MLLACHTWNVLVVDIVNAKCLPKNVSFNPNWVKFDIRVGDNKHLSWGIDELFTSSRALGLNTTINTLPSWFNSAVTQRAQTLQYSEGLNSILVEYDHGNLFELQSVVIEDCNQVVTLMDTTTWVPIANKPVFENLEALSVVNLNNLKELCVSGLPHVSLGNLKSLLVYNCSNLLNPLLPSNLLKRLQNLEKLFISDLSRVEYVFQSEDFLKEQIDLEKFRDLRLFNLPQLENIWRGSAGYAIFRNLQHLKILGCSKLKYVFTYNVSQSLLQLEKLSVDDCSCLEMIIGPGEGTLNKIILPQLTSLYLRWLLQLTSFYTGNNGIEY